MEKIFHSALKRLGLARPSTTKAVAPSTAAEVPREDLPDFSALVAEERRRIEALNTTPESSSGFEEDEDTYVGTDGEEDKQRHVSQSGPMTSDEFRMRAKDLVEYMANYLDQLSDRRVTPAVKPGYLRPRLPEDPPMQGESWDRIMLDVDLHIMTGMTHWQHPRFHAYFPAGNSYPSIMAGMLSDAIGCVGFSWAASPACTELETIVLDWLGRMVDLPKKFLPFTPGGAGGGVLQGSASECILVSLLAARLTAVRELESKSENKGIDRRMLLTKLRAYCSDEAHSSVQKAAMIALVEIRIIPVDDKYGLNSVTLAEYIQKDRDAGLVPFFVSTTLGTTGCCAFDALDEIGPVCEREGIWLHVDAAYAGNSFICPEQRHLMKGIEYASSFNLNPNKWMLVNFDCSAMWVADRVKLTDALTVDPLYLQHDYSNRSIDYRNWSIPLSRRFRSLKLWFVIRSYGVEGLQQYIREHIRLAKVFESKMREDSRFEIVHTVNTGLVCFRLKGAENSLNERLLSSINETGHLHMVPAMLKKRYTIRFCVCSPTATEEDMEHASATIKEWATVITEMDEMEDAVQELRPTNSKTESDSSLDQAGSDPDEPSDNFCVVQTTRKGSIFVPRTPFARLVSDPEYYRRLSNP